MSVARFSLVIAGLCLSLSLALQANLAQAPAARPSTEGYPDRVTDPASVARGSALYGELGCAGCHAADARGASGGPNLIRSQAVQRDRKGEIVAALVRTPTAHHAQPAYRSLTDEQIADIAEFLHGFPVDARDPVRMPAATILTGDGASGQRYFAANCASCHSVTGDLKGLGRRISNPRSLQQRWLSPPTSGKIEAVVTERTGVRTAGTLVRMDEFLLVLKTADGVQRTFVRRGAVPRVALNDRLAAHKALLPRITDANIHDVTAYLVTLK